MSSVRSPFLASRAIDKNQHGYYDDARAVAMTKVEYERMQRIFRVLCRTLRFFAHQAGAALVCTKHKDNTSKYLLRNLLGHLVFGNVKVDLEHLQVRCSAATLRRGHIGGNAAAAAAAATRLAPPRRARVESARPRGRRRRAG